MATPNTQVSLIYPDWDQLDRDERCDVMDGLATIAPEDKRCDVIYCYGDASKRADTVVCERLFEQFNIGDRAGLHVRSMSVGDMVQFRDSFTGAW